MGVVWGKKQVLPANLSEAIPHSPILSFLVPAAVAAASGAAVSKRLLLYPAGIGKPLGVSSGGLSFLRESPMPHSGVSQVCAGYFASTDLKDSMLGLVA